MNIIIDTREQRPYDFARFNCETQVGTLATGDYSLAGLTDRVAVERKSLDDMVGCLTTGRDRFERELARACEMEGFAVVIEASLQDMAEGHYRSQMQPHSAIQSVIAFQVRYGVPFTWAGSRSGAEYIAFSLLRRYWKESQWRLLAASALPGEMLSLETNIEALSRN